MPSLTPPVIPPGRLAASTQPVLPLEGTALSLRPWTVADATAVIAAYADPDIRRWHARTVETEVEARALIERWRSAWSAESGASWAIVRDGAAGADGGSGHGGSGGDVVLGRVGFRMIETELGRAECAYWIMPGARGGGVATKALGALSNWAFEDVGFHRLFLAHSTENDASCRVAVKAGFEPEGVERSSMLHADGWHDMHVHARISE
jgi:[ribosomal protein S5]-alanine N-acetyltransferase